MSSLTANLKLYLPFQKNRFINTLYLVQFAFCLMIFLFPETRSQMITAIEHGLYPFNFMLLLFASMFIFGFMTAAIQIDILIKPLSFNMPGHEKVSLILISSNGISIAVLYFILLGALPLPHTGFTYLIFSILVAASGLAFYFLAVLLSYRMKQVKPNDQIKYIFAVFPFLFYAFYGFGFLIDFKYTFGSYCLLTFLPLCISGVISFFILKEELKNPDLKRKYCTKYEMTFIQNREISITDSWSLNDKKNEPLPELSLGEILFNNFKKSGYLSVKKSFLGLLYNMIEKAWFAFNINGSKKTTLFIILLLTVIQFLAGYRTLTHEVLNKLLPMVQYITVCILCLSASIIFTTDNHEILLPAGRRKSFKANFIVWLIRLIPAVAWAIVTVVVSFILKYFMPQITISGYALSYYPLDIYTAFVPLFLFPAADFFMGKLIPGSGYFIKPSGFFTRIVFAVAMYLLVLSFILTDTTENRVFTLSLMILISNAVFILLLYKRWFRSDVV